jgi:hypothetical protein
MARNKLKQVGKKVLENEKFLPTILITILFWKALAGLVYFTLPASSLYLYFLFTFRCLLVAFSIIFSANEGAHLAVLYPFFLFLDFFGIGKHS